MLLHNSDLSEYVIPYRSFDESFNYYKQSVITVFVFECIMKQVKTKRKLLFGQSWTNHIENVRFLSTICLHHKWIGTRLLSL